MNIWYQMIVTLLCATSVFSKIQLKYKDDFDTQDKILGCAIKIANKAFDYRSHTAVVSEDVDERFVNKFLQLYQGTVIIESKKHAGPPKQVVIIVDSFYSFAKILAKLKPDLQGKTLLSTGAIFLILILSSPQQIERITRFLWSYYILNVIIIINNEHNNTVLYTYYPYIDHLHCQNTRPSFICYCDNKCLRGDIYPDKMQNMRGCPLYVSTNKLYHPNTEQKIPLQIIKKAIVRLLRDVMNFTPIISTRDYVSIDSDRAKNWSDSLNDVIMGVANISISTIPLGYDKTEMLYYTVPYFRVRLAWLAPPICPGPVWWRLLFPLNGYIWIILMTVSIFVKSIPLLTKLKPVNKFCRRYFKNFDKLQGVALRSWGIFMGQPIRVLPVRFRDFYVVTLWMWFTFVIRSVYQSVLIVALKTDSMTGNFIDLEEAVDNGYRYGGRGGILAHFEHDPFIMDGFEIIPEERFDDVFREVIDGKTHFVLATSMEYAWAYCIALGKREDACGHILPDSIMTVPLVVWMKNKSPFIKPLSVWLPRFIEAGLLEKAPPQEVVLTPAFTAAKSSDPSALTQKQTASCMLCLLLGVVISIGVFVFELMSFKTIKYSHRNRNIELVN